MRIRDMYRAPHLRPSDIPDGGAVFTIDRVEVPPGYGRRVALKELGDDIPYRLYFEETPKFLILRIGNAAEIERALGSDESDDWRGRRIRLFVDEGTDRDTGRPFQFICVDPRPVDGLQVATATPPPAPLNTRPIGEFAASELRRRLAEQGLNFDTLMAWLKRRHHAVWELCTGRAFAELPACALVHFDAFLVNPTDQPVTLTPAVQSPETPAAPVAPVLRDEDIPF